MGRPRLLNWDANHAWTASPAVGERGGGVHNDRMNGSVLTGGGWERAAPGLRVSECDGGDDVTFVRFAGELDMATAPVAVQLVLDAATRARTVAVDLSWVTFFDAYAYGSLLEARESLSTRNRELRLHAVHRVVRRVFDLLGRGGLPLPQVTADASFGPLTVTPAVVTVLEETLNAALRRAEADMANAQLLDPTSGTLRIAAQRGFTRRFLDFFEVVERADSACGAALAERQPVWVDDVANSPIFADTPAREVVLDAGVRAVASVPVLTPAGELLAVVSVHRRRAGQWTAGQRDELDRISRAVGQRLAQSAASR